ncbi:MAG: 4-(cytidine 5'-diphospho)-2-C-methyl-D-erythritol kinase [bacterium]|nr:4-(cytidine 5'-diphospho)-2-C-methyl-D-erythritol kinase [bacterium]
MDIIIKAYAKINLHLEVLNRKDDGYHNIFSLMAGVDLFDLLKLNACTTVDMPGGKARVAIANSGGRYKSSIDSIPQDDNLITKGVRLYLEKAGKSGEFDFSLEKNIPLGAGLGGGSADAAAAIKYVHERLESLNSSELLDICAKTGADVPFCMKSGFAFCEGIGEIIEPVNDLHENIFNYWVLVVNDGIHVDTAKAYKSLGRVTESGLSPSMTGTIEEKKRIIKDALAKGTIDGIKDVLTNDFEGPIFQLYPKIGELKKKVCSHGADFTIMTGSGSTIVALYSDKERALEAERSLSGSIKEVLLTRFIP